jgi:hypothetical protein
MRNPVRLLIVFCLAVATSLQAATYIVPTDRDLVQRAEGIVIATADSSHSELLSDGRIVTITRFSIERILKGTIGQSLDLVEPGGVLPDRTQTIFGVPIYEDGKRYLIFLRKTNFGEWATYGWSLGKFDFVDDLRGDEWVTRGSADEHLFGFEEADWKPHVENVRDVSAFLSFIETILNDAQAPAREDYFVDRSKTAIQSFAELRPHVMTTRTSYLSSNAYRWMNGGITNFVYCCAPNFQPGLDGPGAAAAGAANWNGTGTSIHYTITGADNTATGGLITADGKNGILFNDPDNFIPPGIAGAGGVSTDGSRYSLSGETFTDMAEVDVVIAKNVGAATFNGIVTHELGHTLGFRHSNEGPSIGSTCTGPCSSSAIMTSVVPFGLQVLQQWDTCAALTVYGNGGTPPAITTQPASTTITSGQQTTLSVAATGANLTYQWYVGSSGVTTTPVSNATNSSLTVSPTTTTTYWVQVTACSSTNSNAATVTVNQPTCTPPTAPTPTAVPSSISSGQSSTLSVSPTGTGPFTYQWYVGPSGDTSNQIAGATNSSTTVSPTVTTSYWVKVTGQCAPASNSPATTVTVTVACTPIAGVSALPSTINVGQSSTLSVSTSGAGPFTFQWYRGGLGDTSNPIATSSSTVVSPTVSTAYWVHVTAPCGSQDGNVTVFVNAACTQSSITTHPSFATIAPGGSATLTVVAAGSAPISYQWYTGTSGNTNSPIPNATNASVTVSPTVTTSYWVHVANSCNTVGNNSVTALVTVSTNCPAATITTQPASVSAPIGTAATLNVVATITGTTIHYQWYKGAKGDLSTKVGTDSPTFTTGTVAVTASYWVRLTSACNNLTFTDGNAAIVTAVATPKGRAVRH